MIRVAGYGTWKSPISAEMVTRGQVGLQQPMIDRGMIYWLEARPEEAGRVVLVRRSPGGPRHDLTEAPLNVRTRVHNMAVAPLPCATGSWSSPISRTIGCIG
jgi:hypothetical protein